MKIARMTLTIKLDGNWSSFQVANSAPPLSVTDSAMAPSARIPEAESFLWSKNKIKKIGSNPLYNPRTSIVTRVGCAATGLVLCQRNT